MKSIYNAHIDQEKQYNIKIEKIKKDLKVNLDQLSDNVFDEYNAKISVAYNNEKKIQHESNRLQKNLQELEKKSKMWVAMVKRFDTSLKELGDLENWSQIVTSNIINNTNTNNVE
ncbi:hypothetical protein SNEBB_005951 [Seison nebaliae]|nr:hypothetical protein SNEBB_005951 [Seison nebaliae]